MFEFEKQYYVVSTGARSSCHRLASFSLLYDYRGKWAPSQSVLASEWLKTQVSSRASFLGKSS